MSEEVGSGVFVVDWIVNPFRGDRFEEAWAPYAEAALDYGAGGYGFFRNKDDRLRFTQLAFFETKLDWERYWYSEQISNARVEVSGLYQVPLLPVFHGVIGFRTRLPSPVDG